MRADLSGAPGAGPFHASDAAGLFDVTIRKQFEQAIHGVVEGTVEIDVLSGEWAVERTPK